MASRPLLREDLDHVIQHAAPAWHALQGARLFITGGTGFFGRWLLESIAHANDQLECRVQATIVSRDPASFLDDMPHLKNRREFSWLQGEPARFEFPRQGHDHILHMATATSPHVDRIDPMAMLETKFASARHVLDFARHCGARRLLLTSSGAVYGPQPSHIERIPENYPGAPDPCNPASAYGEGKRMVELMCNLASGIECVTARCFSFIGPHLPLDARFAAGNFLRDALAGQPISIKGDGRTVRSYLHAADLTVWLLSLLIMGEKGTAYNVGSPVPVTISDLADLVSSISALAKTGIMRTPLTPVHRYVPDTRRCRQELGLLVRIPLDAAIARTLEWLRSDCRHGFASTGQAVSQ